MDEAVALDAFLRVAAEQFCDGCLGDALGLPSEDVKAAIFSSASAFARVYGVCRRCRRRQAVTGLRLAA